MPSESRSTHRFWSVRRRQKRLAASISSFLIWPEVHSAGSSARNWSRASSLSCLRFSARFLVAVVAHLELAAAGRVHVCSHMAPTRRRLPDPCLKRSARHPQRSSVFPRILGFRRFCLLIAMVHWLQRHPGYLVQPSCAFFEHSCRFSVSEYSGN